MIRLGLLRHGRTDWNAEGRLQGRIDRPLDDAEARRLARLAPPPGWVDVDCVSSPLRRARETARLVTGTPARIAPALIEMNWGDWEGQRGAALRADPASGYRDIEHWGWDYTPPGGESPAAMRARLLPFLSGLERDTLAVCHIGVMRVLLALAHGWDFAGPPPFAVKRDRIYPLRLSGGGPVTDGAPVRLVESEAPCVS